MKNLSLAVLIGVFLFLGGCGSPDNGNPGGEKEHNGNTTVVDASFSIDLSKVPGYDSTDPINNQYLAVINYLRSLSIKCNDSSALSGPVGVDLSWEDHVAAAAKEHSEDMRLSVHYNHDGSGTVNDKTAQALGLARGSRFDERIIHNGYTGGTQAENIAIMEATGSSPASDSWVKVMEGWTKSTHGHCSNIMNPNLTDFGMHESRAAKDGSGVYKIYWTQDFGGQ